MSLRDKRLDFPATARNRQPILEVLSRILPDKGTVLEIGSGSGQHAAHFASALPDLTWQPSDPEPNHRASIAAYAAAASLSNVRTPLDLDVTIGPWPITEAVAVLSINMTHIAPWQACTGLLAGAGDLLGEGGLLFIYGPFKRAGQHTAPSNAAFDRSLRAEDPAWGLRSLETVTETAAHHRLDLSEVVEMPSNNLSLVFQKT